MYILYRGQYIAPRYYVLREILKLHQREGGTFFLGKERERERERERKRERKREKEDLFIQEPDQYMQVVPLSFCRKVFIQSFDMTYIHSVEKSLFIRKDWLLFILQKSLYSLILHDFHSFCRN